MDVKDSTTRHRIRSFVRREGRLTPGQQRAIDSLGPQYLLKTDKSLLDAPKLFNRQAPITLEIGFGDGQSLSCQAKEHPERDFVGIEVHRPGVGRLLQLIEQENLTNVRIFNADAVEVLETKIPDGSLNTVQIFFPDPWHKKRHHKRRIIQSDFVALLARKLEPNGRLHLATDWEDYALHMTEVIDSSGLFMNRQQWGTGNGNRPPTKFEQRGKLKGHGIYDIIYRKSDISLNYSES
ncbi:tRNA (guanosine(46)-N7)-methyltransferase TrmB [Acidihalobacter prosperus]